MTAVLRMTRMLLLLIPLEARTMVFTTILFAKSTGSNKGNGEGTAKRTVSVQFCTIRCMVVTEPITNNRLPVKPKGPSTKQWRFRPVRSQYPLNPKPPNPKPHFWLAALWGQGQRQRRLVPAVFCLSGGFCRRV